MRFSKSVLFAASLIAGFSLFADHGGNLISFSTQADTYADGTPVLDGEWYALVWSADGNFDGINLDCTPVDANDEVVYVASLAKGGRCPDVLFWVPTAKAHATGSYQVYLLDTRNVEKTAVAAANGDALPQLNGAKVSESYVAKSAFGASEAQPAAGSAKWEASGIDASKIPDQKVKITAFQVVGAKVNITVSNMIPGVRYNVSMGSEPGDLKDLGLVVPQTAENPTFVIDKADARFFKVIRQPLDK